MVACGRSDDDALCHWCLPRSHDAPGLKHMRHHLWLGLGGIEGQKPRRDLLRGHLVLQALCRASVRKGRSGAAASCEAYLVASKRSGIEAMLPGLFPGCTVKTWEPVKRCLPKTARAALDYLAAWAAKSPIGAQVKFTDVYKALGINQDVFRKQVRGNKDLLAALADLGIMEAGTAKRKTMYARQ